MIKIDYPQTKPRQRVAKGREEIFCMIRKRWLRITPEEWVRQNFLLYLTEVLAYPPSLIAVEKQVSAGELQKRFDIVVYRNSVPYLIVECKEMNVILSEKTILQILNYNAKISAAMMVITNGITCAAFQRSADQFISITEIPAFTR